MNNLFINFFMEFIWLQLINKHTFYIFNFHVFFLYFLFQYVIFIAYRLGT